MKSDPGGLQIKPQRPMLFQGKEAAVDASGRYPTGTTALYVVAHRSGPMVMPLVRQADRWRVDLRWWIAMTDLAAGTPARAGSPELAIRSMLAAMLRLNRAQATRYLSDPKQIDYLFLDAPSSREPSGVLDATVEEMPLVRLGAGEFARFPNDRVVEGGTAADEQLILGLFGPVEMPFIVHHVGTMSKVEAQPYFDLMNQ